MGFSVGVTPIPQTIPSGATYVVPAGYGFVMCGPLTVNGTLIVTGDLRVV